MNCLWRHAAVLFQLSRARLLCLQLNHGAQQAWQLATGSYHSHLKQQISAQQKLQQEHTVCGILCSQSAAGAADDLLPPAPLVADSVSPSSSSKRPPVETVSSATGKAHCVNFTLPPDKLEHCLTCCPAFEAPSVDTVPHPAVGTSHSSVAGFF